MPLRAAGAHALGSLPIGPRLRIEAVPRALGGVVRAFDLLGDVDQLAPRLPERFVVGGVVRQRHPVVRERLGGLQRGMETVAALDLRRRGCSLPHEGAHREKGNDQGRQTAHRGLHMEAKA